MSGTREIDFSYLTEAEEEAIVECVRTIAAYEDEIKQIRESIKDTLEDISVRLNADKDSTKLLKKYVRKASSIVAKRIADEVSDDNARIDLIVALTEKKEREGLAA